MEEEKLLKKKKKNKLPEANPIFSLFLKPFLCIYVKFIFLYQQNLIKI